MNQYHPPGQKCMLAIEKLDELGPMIVRDLVVLVPGTTANVLSASLLRAVRMGYLTVKRGNRRVDNCNTFQVVPDWRDVHINRLALYVKQPRKSRARVRTKWKCIASVFQLGDMHA